MRTTDVRWLLERDHQRLNELIEDLRAAFNANAQEDCNRLWSEFDAALEAHFALEEREVLPLFAKVDPREAAALIAEHEQIRERVAELGIGVDLHMTRADRVQELTDRLRVHAERENALMYRWAQASLGDESKRSIRSKLPPAR